MLALPLLLVVIAACTHASWNVIAKRAAGAGVAFIFAYNFVACVCYGPIVAWMALDGRLSWSWPIAGCVMLSSVVHLAYSLCLQRGYALADLSVVYPVARGTGPVLATIGAVVLLGEAVTPLRLAGLVAIVAGIVMIATRGNLAAFARPGGKTGVKWGSATGGLIASYTVVDAYGVTELGIAPLALDWFSNTVRFFLLVPVVAAKPTEARKRMRGKWGLAVLVGLLSPLGYIFVLTALSMGAPLSVVAPMREMSMMVGAVLGMIVLREPVSAWRLLGCAIVIAGVLLLSLK